LGKRLFGPITEDQNRTLQIGGARFLVRWQRGVVAARACAHQSTPGSLTR